MIGEAKLKSKRYNLPIFNDTLVAIITKAVLASDDLTRTNDKWEDLNTTNKTWSHWKDDYPKSHTKCTFIRKAAGDGDSFGSINITHQAYPPHSPDSGPPKLHS